MMTEITVLQHIAKVFSYKCGNEASLSKVYPVGCCSLTHAWNFASQYLRKWQYLNKILLHKLQWH